MTNSAAKGAFELQKDEEDIKVVVAEQQFLTRETQPDQQSPPDKPSPPASAAPSLLSLVRFTTKKDKVLLAFAVLLSVGQGLTLPFIAFTVGDMTNALVENDNGGLFKRYDSDDEQSLEHNRDEHGEDTDDKCGETDSRSIAAV